MEASGLKIYDNDMVDCLHDNPKNRDRQSERYQSLEISIEQQ
jgi:N-acetylmuramic acid 6-phosphate (MurNAc-6-P) etherase